MYIKNIYKYFIIIIFLQGCKTNKFIDYRNSFKEWSEIPMNSNYLKINMIDNNTSKKIYNHSYYIAPSRFLNASTEFSLVEVNNEKKIMNIFPLPLNKDTIDITGRSLFPSPTVVLEGLRISTNFKNDTAYYRFAYYSLIRGSKVIRDSIEPNLVKHVIINFKNKSAVIIDTTKTINKKIWF